MINFYDYFSEDYRYTLYSIQYNKIENNFEGNLVLSATDEIAVEPDNGQLACLYTRTLQFEPQDVFFLRITYKIIFDVKEKANISTLTAEEIHASLYENAIESLGQVAARMSFVTAQVLTSGNHEPILMPPVIIHENEVAEESNC